MAALGYDVYPCACVFPGCKRPAPLPGEDDLALCAEHERLRFYWPDEFSRGWERTAAEE